MGWQCFAPVSNNILPADHSATKIVEKYYTILQKDPLTNVASNNLDICSVKTHMQAVISKVYEDSGTDF